MSEPLILLTNDDGVYAPGLRALRAALLPLGRVAVVAPDRPRSASGHAITLHKPLRVSDVRLPDGAQARATSGTPSDCVLLAFRDLLDRKPDLVVSGINDGPNLGWDLTYSGTVSAAMEGAILGVPSLAISLVRSHEPGDGAPIDDSDALEEEISVGHVPGTPPEADVADFVRAAAVARDLCERLLREGLPIHTLLNVNVPFRAGRPLRGRRVTRLGVRKYPGLISRRIDPMGRPYYWLGGDVPEDRLDAGTDVEAVAAGSVSITPVHMDMTDYRLLEQLRDWERVD